MTIIRESDCIRRGDVINKLREGLEHEADVLGLPDLINRIPACNVVDAKEIESRIDEVEMILEHILEGDPRTLRAPYCEGAQRYDSVYRALKICREIHTAIEDGIVNDRKG